VTWTTYGTFVGLAALLVVAPGPDFAVVLKNSLAGGRRRGLFTSLGVVNSNMVQGTAAAFGVGAVIVRSQALFEVVRWAGVAYLCFLGVQALRSAVRRRSAADPEPSARRSDRPRALAGWRQGFLSNITNPKVLVFYLSVLPQFLEPARASTVDALGLAYTHAVLSLVWLCLLVTVFHRVRGWVSRARVRRALDALTGTVLVGFGLRLATEGR